MAVGWEVYVLEWVCLGGFGFDDGGVWRRIEYVDF
jgi:hypothetical protein